MRPLEGEHTVGDLGVARVQVASLDANAVAEDARAPGRERHGADRVRPEQPEGGCRAAVVVQGMRLGAADAIDEVDALHVGATGDRRPG